MGLARSYSLLAPLYDPVIGRASRAIRARSLARLAPLAPAQVLISGIGTGLDVPLLPPQHRYTGVDLTRAMLARVPRPRHGLDLVQGDAMRLPFRDACFDHAVLHLIVAVVPRPEACLAEAARVVRPGGKLLLLDKFLRAEERGLFRRALNPVTRRIATRLDVVFERVLEAVPGLQLAADEPALLGGWFRMIELVRR